MHWLAFMVAGCGKETVRNWECFCDESYYGLWAVRPVGENRWGHCFHVQTKEEAEGLRDLLNELQEKANKMLAVSDERQKGQTT